jgi:hypothetical protein
VVRQSRAEGVQWGRLGKAWSERSHGTFLTQDPLGLAGGVNLYAYAGNNPVAFRDPFGLNPCLIAPQLCMAVATVAVVAATETGARAYSNYSSGRPILLGLASAALRGIRDGMASVIAGEGIGAAVGRLAGAASSLADDAVIVRGGQGPVPNPGEVVSGASGKTLEEAASGVPHGTIRATTAGEIRRAGGTVTPNPEYTRSGILNDRHVDICLGSGPCPFGDPMPNPVPKAERIQ